MEIISTQRPCAENSYNGPYIHIYPFVFLLISSTLQGRDPSIDSFSTAAVSVLDIGIFLPGCKNTTIFKEYNTSPTQPRQ